MSKTCEKIPMRYLIILLVIILPSTGISQSIIRCMDIFSKSKSLEYKLSSKTELTNPYSKELFLNLYQQIENNSLLSKKEKQEFILNTEAIIHFIESHPHNQKLEVLTPQLLSAVQSLPAIFEFTKNPSSSYLDTTTALKVVLVSLTRYTRAYIMQESNHLDWPRLHKILSVIAHFKTNPNAFSLYKILRAVREKHSLKEFINCR